MGNAGAVVVVDGFGSARPFPVPAALVCVLGAPLSWSAVMPWERRTITIKVRFFPWVVSLRCPPVRYTFFADDDTVIQLNSSGPWGINYINPKDDPRPKM